MNDTIKDWIYAFVEALIIIAVLYLLFWPVSIDGISMENTLYTGDKVIISKIMTLLRVIDYGDIVVCRTDSDDEKRNIVKRVIALPGDTLEIYGGAVYVNGAQLYEPYVIGTTLGDMKTYVPDGYLFIMGDNRENSLDSREIGSVSYGSLTGKLILRWFPFKNAKTY